MKKTQTSVFLDVWVLFPKFFGRFKGWLMLELPKIIMVSNLVVFATDFYFVLWARLAGRSVQSYKEWAFCSIFSRLGLYPQVFEQVKKWLIVGFREIAQVPHIVECLMDFNLRCYRGQQDGVLKPKKIFIFRYF